MSIWNSKTYRQDIMNALNCLDLDILRNKRILITGATGLIGSAILDLLICANQERDANISIYAAGRSINKLKTRFSYYQKELLHFVIYDATKTPIFDFSVNYIIHAASNASPDKYMNEPVDTLLANVIGVHNLLDYAVKRNVTKVLYISSSEVYGKLNHGNPLREDEYGAVDILTTRSSYAMGKRASETLMIGYSNQYNVGVSIVRPGHIYGPTAQSSDNRVSSVFAIQAANGENLVMKSLGTQLRSYCYCIDCATATLTVLTRGQDKEAYNISNKKSVITIRQMAEIIARCAKVQLIMDIPTELEKITFNPMDNSSLDSMKLESLGWQGQFDAESGFCHTIQILKELQ